MTHQHSGADDAVAHALADEVRSQALRLDYGLLAEAAVDAVLDYEDRISDEYCREHPESLDAGVADDSVTLARRIRQIECPYTGTEGVAFREARERAAQMVEQS